jgi:hypothetical protein
MFLIHHPLRKTRYVVRQNRKLDVSCIEEAAKSGVNARPLARIGWHHSDSIANVPLTARLAEMLFFFFLETPAPVRLQMPEFQLPPRHPRNMQYRRPDPGQIDRTSTKMLHLQY